MNNDREKDEWISDHIFKNDSREYVLKYPTSLYEYRLINMIL